MCVRPWSSASDNCFARFDFMLGLIAGFIASKLVNKSGEGLVGGFVFSFFGASGINGLNLYALPFAESTR
jgi:uncharacterized membrane protein YeaQ/YmgE (transglycosylase-associated protein family)